MLVECVLQQFGLQQTSLFGDRAADVLNLIAKISRRKLYGKNTSTYCYDASA